jgi:hypothetical protein
MSKCEYTVEQDWVTEEGFRAVVMMGSMGFRCGYVGIPASHPLHGVDYSATSGSVLPLPDDECIGNRGVIPLMLAAATGEHRLDVIFDVHGSLTYSGGSPAYPVESDGLWWFGFDCGHFRDAPSDEYLEKRREEFPDKSWMWSRDYASVHRSREYCAAECENLAHQLVSRVRANA